MYKYELLRKIEIDRFGEYFFRYKENTRDDILCYCITDEELSELERQAYDNMEYVSEYNGIPEHYTAGVSAGSFNNDVIIVIYDERQVI